MNDIRILIPWHELDERTKRDMGWTPVDGYPDAKMYAYALIERNCTRSITPEDIRSCLRMPDEWTEEEYEEHRSKCYSGNSVSAAFNAIDIALRAAPEEDPWELMDEAIRCLHMEADRGVMAEVQKIWTELKKAEGK